MRCSISRDRPSKPILNEHEMANLERVEELLQQPNLSSGMVMPRDTEP